MGIHRWKEDFLKKSNVPLELHKGMSKIIITKSHNMIIIKKQKQKTKQNKTW